MEVANSFSIWMECVAVVRVGRECMVIEISSREVQVERIGSSAVMSSSMLSVSECTVVQCYGSISEHVKGMVRRILES